MLIHKLYEVERFLAGYWSTDHPNYESIRLVDDDVVRAYEYLRWLNART